MFIDFVRLSILDGPSSASLLFPLLEKTLTLGSLALLDGHDPTRLVIL